MALGRAACHAVEVLEDRQMLSTYFVNMTGSPNSSTGSTHAIVDVPGYMTDIGSPFGDRADRGNSGVSYGWVNPGTHTPVNNELNGRNRDSGNHPTYPYSANLELYDSFNHMQKTTNPGPASWEIAVPNGTYVVHVASADPNSTTAGDSHDVILAEGVQVYDYNEPAGGGNNSFVEGTVLATVTDGNLTISTASNSVNAKLAFVEITSYTSAAPTVAPTIAASQSGSSVIVSWKGTPQAITYNIYRGSSANGETLLQSGVTGTKFTDASPLAGTDFYYILPANPAGVSTVKSNEVSISPAGPTAAPTIAVTQVGDSASLTWAAVPVASTYNIYRGSTSQGETLIKSGVTATTYVDPTPSGTNYYYVVAANPLGTGPQSNEVSFTAVAPTQAPSLTVLQSGGSAALTWTAVPLATTFNIYRGDGNSPETLLQSGVTGTTFLDNNPTIQFEFYYVVPANSAGTGPQSNEGNIFFSPPQTAPTLSVVPSSGKVSLSWVPDSFSGKFDIYRGSSSGGEQLIKTGATGTTYDDTAITIGSTYYYYIIPTNIAGSGPQSNEVSTTTHATFVHVNFQTASTVTPAGYLPDVGLAYGDRGNTFSYGWWNSPNATTNATPTADLSTRERGNTSSPDKRYDTFEQLHKGGESPAGNNWWEIAVPNGTYLVRVVGGESDNFDETLVFYAEANKDPVTGQPLIDGSGTPLINQVMTTTARWADSGFIPVTVTDGNLTISDGPGFANTKIDFVDIDTTNVVTVPADPTNLTITNVHASNLTLNWTDNSTNETGFRIEQSSDGVNFTSLTTVPAQAGTGTDSFSVAGLSPQTKYYYRVFATNLQGDSANPTNIENSTTLAATGGIAGRINNTLGNVNLTTEGTLDWAHWGATTASTFDHKSSVTSLISDVTPISGSTKVQIGGSPTTFTWSDGTTNATANATGNNLGTFAYGHGFSFTVPADTTPRVLRIYVGVNNVRGQLTARLSDGSAPDFVDSSLFNAAATDGVYTLNYSAASAGQTMTVTWIEVPPNGDQAGGRLTLKAATLQAIPDGVSTGTTTLNINGLSSGRNLLTWNASSPNNWGYTIERAPDNGGVPGAFTTLVTLDYPRTSYFDESQMGLGSVKFYYRVTPFNLLGQTGAVSNVVNATTPGGPFGSGAQATYFTYSAAPPAVNDPYLGTLWPVSSLDPTINFNWGTGAPAGAGANFPTDNFLTHWTFKLKPEFTETYTFYADVDDGYRLIINGQQILNGLSRRGGVGTQFASTPINLVAGQTYDVSFDQIEQAGSAGARLYWQSASLPEEIIPKQVMFPTTADPTPPKVTSISVDGAIPAGYTYTPAQHLVVHFNKSVAASQNAINVTINSTDFTTFYSGGQLDVKFDVASNTALITFPNLGNTPLPDGNYNISIDAFGLSDFSGNSLDGNGDGTAGDQYTGTFYELTGDSQVGAGGVANADRQVNFNDFQRLELGFGKIATDRPTASDGDFNHDGVVDRLDLQLLNQQMNKVMAPPPAPAPTPSPVVAVPPAPVAVSPAPVGKPAPVSTKPLPVSTKPAPVTVSKPTVVAIPAAAPKPAPVAKPLSVTKPLITSIKPVIKPVTTTAFSDKRVRGVGDWLTGL